MMQPPDLRIVSLIGTPRTPFDEFEEEIATTKVTVHRIENSPAIYASLDVLIPSAVGVVLAMGDAVYTKTFAEEAAGASIRLIEVALRRLARRMLGPEGPETVPLGRSHSSVGARYSHRFGIVADLGESRRIRLVLIPDEDPAPAIACFFRALEQLHSPKAAEIQVTGDPGSGLHGLFVRYDPTVNGLVFIDPMTPPEASEADTGASPSGPHPGTTRLE